MSVNGVEVGLKGWWVDDLIPPLNTYRIICSEDLYHL